MTAKGAMAGKRVLIVAEADEVGRMLQAALMSLAAGLVVRVVASAEEALMDPMLGYAQLLVTDTRLQSMSGFDLLAKFRQRNPQVRAILLARKEDDSAQNRALLDIEDHLVVKPVRSSVFLDTVREVLQLHPVESPVISRPALYPFDEDSIRLKQAEKPAEQAPQEDSPVEPDEPEMPEPQTETPAESISIEEERLRRLTQEDTSPPAAEPVSKPAEPAVTNREKESVEDKTEPTPRSEAAGVPAGVKEMLGGLCQRLGAGAAMIMDMEGRILAQAGSLPGWDGQKELFPVLLTAMQAAGKAAQQLQPGAPQGVLALYGAHVNLAAAPLGGQVLVMLTPAEGSGLRAALAFEEVLLASRALQQLFTPPESGESQPLDLESLLSGSKPALNADQLSAFWEAALAEHPSAPGSGETLSYDQAARLDLTPDDDPQI